MESRLPEEGGAGTARSGGWLEVSGMAEEPEDGVRWGEDTERRGGGAIPAVDPRALGDLAGLAVQVAAQVEELLRKVHGALQNLSTLSVGCIQTYRDSAEGLGEAVDASIRSMYTLMTRCEELDRELQPVPALAARIREMKSTLERLEGLCR